MVQEITNSQVDFEIRTNEHEFTFMHHTHLFMYVTSTSSITTLKCWGKVVLVKKQNCVS